jgi:hypothetical protein
MSFISRASLLKGKTFMMRLKLIPLVLVGSILTTSWSPGAFAGAETAVAQSNSCKALLQVKIGAKFSPEGNISVGMFHSKYPKLEESLNSMAQFILGRTLMTREISEVTRRFVEDKSEDAYFTKLARAFDLSANIEEMAEFKKRIPEKGPLLVLLNHPNNGRETIAIAAAISLVRSDVKVALTHFLKNYPGMEENGIFLDPSPSPEASAYNASQRKKMDDWMKAGGVLIAHPSGEVSNLNNSPDGVYAMDPRWRIGMAKLIEANPDVQILPVFIDGQAGPGFQKVKQMKPEFLADTIGQVFHLRELAGGQGHVFPMNIGSVIKGSDALQLVEKELDKNSSDDKKSLKYDLMKLMQIMRARVYALKGKFEKKADAREMKPIAEATPKALIKSDIDKMQLLTSEKGLEVRIAQGKNIPNVLREIGRLREVSFRNVGEASGERLDLDRFDEHYYHVVMYKPDTDVIVGAYRIAFVDKVIQEVGLQGVYHSTLFETSKLPYGEYKNTIELGRAFVNAELVDRDARSAIYFLPLIWKAIAKVLEQNPKYTQLMGPVSISNVFSDVSKAIMISYLEKNYGSPLKDFVSPRTPFTPKTPVLAEGLSLVPTIKDLKQLNTVIKDIDGSPIPSLISSYEKLGARYLGFNFDPAFNAIDGLIIVNLLQSDRTELKKYFGEEGLRNYLRYHGINLDEIP